MVRYNFDDENLYVLVSGRRDELVEQVFHEEWQLLRPGAFEEHSHALDGSLDVLHAPVPVDLVELELVLFRHHVSRLRLDYLLQGTWLNAFLRLFFKTGMEFFVENF